MRDRGVRLVLLFVFIGFGLPSFPLNVRRSIHEQLFAKVPLTNEAWADIERKCEGIQNQNQSREVPVPAA
jgi:hypothetical protein